MSHPSNVSAHYQRACSNIKTGVDLGIYKVEDDRIIEFATKKVVVIREMTDDSYLSMEPASDSISSEAKKTAVIYKSIHTRSVTSHLPDTVATAYQGGLNQQQIEAILGQYEPDRSQEPENFIFWLAEIYRFPAPEFTAALTNLQNTNSAYKDVLEILNEADDDLKEQRNYAGMTPESSVVGSLMRGGRYHTALEYFRYRYTDKTMRETGGVYRELYKATAAREDVYEKGLAGQAFKATEAEAAEPKCYVSNTPPAHLVALIQHFVAPHYQGKVSKILLIAELYRIHPQILLDVLNDPQNALSIPDQTIRNVTTMVSSLNLDPADTRFSYLPLLTSDDASRQIIKDCSDDMFTHLLNRHYRDDSGRSNPPTRLIRRAQKRKTQTAFAYIGYFINKPMQNAVLRVASPQEIQEQIEKYGDQACCTISHEPLKDIKDRKELIVVLEQTCPVTATNPTPSQSVTYYDANMLDTLIKRANGKFMNISNRAEVGAYEHPRPRRR